VFTIVAGKIAGNFLGTKKMPVTAIADSGAGSTTNRQHVLRFSAIIIASAQNARMIGPVESAAYARFLPSTSDNKMQETIVVRPLEQPRATDYRSGVEAV
jgi:hypothetical protein